MGVVMKGGTSGCRQDYNASLGGSPSMPLVDTASSGAAPASVHFQAEAFNRDHPQAATPSLPTGGSVPENIPDVCDQETGIGPGAVNGKTWQE